MASVFGHTISIIGFKKLFPDNALGKKVLLLGIVSALIPDIDVLAYNFGISSGILGHRGLTHSIFFAVVWAFLLVVIFHKKERSRYLFIMSFYFFCTSSHGILDSMTTGGDGISFFFPVTETRYFFPYRFIEVSPIGVGSFFGEWGLKVLASEFKYIGIPSILLYGIGYFFNKKIYNGASS